MNKNPFKIKVGDRAPSLHLQLGPDSVDITAKSVLVSMKNLETGVAVFTGRSTNIISPVGPAVVGYLWQAGDTDIAGMYSIEAYILHPGNIKESFPGYWGDNPVVLISPKIG